MIPAEDIVHVYNGSLLFDGDKLRFKADQPIWSGVEKRYFAPSRDQAWNGKVGTALSLNQQNGKTAWQGSMYPDAGMVRADIRVRSFMNYYRPSTRQMSLPLERYVTVGSRKTADGRECVVLSGGRSINAVRDEVWIDLARGGTVERMVSSLHRAVLGQTEVTYTEDADHGWIISGWQRTQYGVDGVLKETITATVLEAKFNMPLAPDEFELKFPPGTSIIDATSGKPVRYVVPQDSAE